MAIEHFPRLDYFRDLSPNKISTLLKTFRLLNRVLPIVCALYQNLDLNGSFFVTQYIHGVIECYLLKHLLKVF